MPNNPSVRWVVDRLMAERAYVTGRPLLVDALRHEGFEVVEGSFTPGAREPDPAIPAWDGECVVAYGSVQFVRQLTRARAGSWQPGAFLRTERLSYSAYGAHLGDLMLNSDFVILPYGEFRRRGLEPWGGRAFIRPDAVSKAFTGFVIAGDDFGLETNFLERLAHVMPEDLVAVAAARRIAGEFRFVIADGEVVTGSTYGWGGQLDVRSDVHEGCLELAKEVAGREWQADRVYTCDIALEAHPDGDRPRLLELNAFSCSGLYACDTRQIAKAVSEAAWKEWSGD